MILSNILIKLLEEVDSYIPDEVLINVAQVLSFYVVQVSEIFTEFPRDSSTCHFTVAPHFGQIILFSKFYFLFRDVFFHLLFQFPLILSCAVYLAHFLIL